ncbi:MAG: NADH-quinone oxidoreductase subunit A [Caldilinea sp.]|nr:NADH-quinone oxidoreductase subunit A [Caldilinea sp.]MDW8439515.1 NADH-quinone oxidoreductase subunit A [Caldilineaceae bacterium]
MLSQWGFVLILSAIAVIIPVAAIVLGHFLGPRRPDPIKMDVYESGVETIGDTWVQFRAQYYLIGLIFLIFDVEVIFLFPIAVAYAQLSFFSIIAAVTFVLILLLGLFLEWRKGALEWT